MKRNKCFAKRNSYIVLVAYLVLMVMFVAGTTLAFLITKTDSVDNTFNPSQVTSEVIEDIDGLIKKDVKIRNTGNIKAYIRAMIIVTWQDEKGNIYGKKPVEGTDYEIEYATNGWIRSSDGFCYWTEPVEAEKETGVLIESCTQKGNAPYEGYYLNVEIIGSGIQSIPTSVVTTEWSSGVSGVNGTTLQIKQ